MFCVWGVRTDGCWIENAPDGWWMIPERVPTDRLRLLETDVAGGHEGEW
jgi:hypothetical protein